QEDDCVVEDRGTCRVRDYEVGRVAVADEVDLRAVDLQRLIDLDGLLLPRRRRTLAIRDVCLEQARRATLGSRALEVDRELVEGEREWREIVGTDEPSAAPRVELREGVRESVALLDDD